MTVILRRTDERQHYRRLKRVGECWVSFSEVVGIYGSGPIKQFVWIN